MLLLHSSLSFSLIALVFILGVLAYRDTWALIQGKLLVALCSCFILLIVITLPESLRPSAGFYWTARFISVLNVGIVWWFALSLLKDDFSVSNFTMSGFVFLTLLPLCYALYDFGFKFISVDFLNSLRGFPSFLMVGHIVWVAFKEKSNDLVEKRRKVRVWLALAIVIASFITILSENFPNHLSDNLVRLMIGLPVTVMAIIWLARINPNALTFETAGDNIASPENGHTHFQVQAKDMDLHQKLTMVMENDEFYKKPHSTVKLLADRLDCKEHHLRTLINQGLGHRNFSSFLATYRLAWAKTLLSDPVKSRLPIISVATESGFASLQTFNRVFKASQGCSPTDYRKQTLNRLAQK